MAEGVGFARWAALYLARSCSCEARPAEMHAQGTRLMVAGENQQAEVLIAAVPAISRGRSHAAQDEGVRGDRSSLTLRDCAETEPARWLSTRLPLMDHADRVMTAHPARLQCST